MSEAGIFANERVELLDGTIVTMSPQSSPHAGTAYRLHRLLERTLGDEFCVRGQLSVVLDDWSEPEPDVAVCKVDARDYTTRHPAPEDIVLVCEVAISSLAYDRAEKAIAYARSGIREYWIVDVERRALLVFADPDPAACRYRTERTLREGGTLVAPNGLVLAVADVLPPR